MPVTARSAKRHAKLAGAPSSRTLLKVLSAQSGCRVFVPLEDDDTTVVTFEGSLAQARAGLALAVRSLTSTGSEPAVLELRISGSSEQQQ